MRLLLDVMWGGIRAHLRMCGHDAAYTLSLPETYVASRGITPIRTVYADCKVHTADVIAALEARNLF